MHRLAFAIYRQHIFDSGWNETLFKCGAVGPGRTAGEATGDQSPPDIWKSLFALDANAQLPPLCCLMGLHGALFSMNKP